MLPYEIYKSHGMVLVMVLILMFVLSLLGWYAVESILLETKMVEVSFRHQVEINAAEHILDRAELNLENDVPNCLIPKTDLAILMSKPIDWWQLGESCTGNFHNFQY